LNVSALQPEIFAVWCQLKIPQIPLKDIGGLWQTAQKAQNLEAKVFLAIIKKREGEDGFIHALKFILKDFFDNESFGKSMFRFFGISLYAQ
jgi:hypothetical protein